MFRVSRWISQTSSFALLGVALPVLLASGCARSPQARTAEESPTVAEEVTSAADPTPPASKAGAAEPERATAAAEPGAAPSPPGEPAAAAQPTEGKPVGENGAQAASKAQQRPRAVPPDGVWLKDEDGREYYIEKFPKIEGYYYRRSDGSVRLRYGLILDEFTEDDDYFYYKVYKVGPSPVPARAEELTPEEVAAIEASYEVEIPDSDRIRLLPFDEGLPDSGQWRNGFDIADMNGDGHLDIVHGPARKGAPLPNVFLGDGAGHWRLWKELEFPPAPYDYGDAAAADFDGDGRMDLALAIHMRGLLALRADADSELSLWSDGLPLNRNLDKTTTFSSRAIEPVDWNGDGRPDLLVLSEGPTQQAMEAQAQQNPGNQVPLSYGVALYVNQGQGRWQERRSGGEAAEQVFGDSLAVGDFNGDGRPDFATGSSVGGNRAIVHLGRADGGWSSVAVPELRPRPLVWAVAAADLDRDGRDDLAVAYSSLERDRKWHNGLDAFYSRPSPGDDDTALGWKRRGVAALESKARLSTLSAGDVDGDGNVDLVAFSNDGRGWVFLGDGEGFFTREKVEVLAEAQPGCHGYYTRLADLDGDGRDEIVAGFAGDDCPRAGSLRAWKAVPRLP